MASLRPKDANPKSNILMTLAAFDASSHSQMSISVQVFGVARMPVKRNCVTSYNEVTNVMVV